MSTRIRTRLVTCQSCAKADRKGYCAPNRCYCAHRDCHAAHSYTELASPDFSAAIDTKQHAAAWANRKESTWIDQM